MSLLTFPATRNIVKTHERKMSHFARQQPTKRFGTGSAVLMRRRLRHYRQEVIALVPVLQVQHFFRWPWPLVRSKPHSHTRTRRRKYYPR